MRNKLFILLAVFSSIFFGGCTAEPPVTDPFSVAPNDFSLDVTVVSAQRQMPEHLKSSRFVVFPNGALHHGNEDGWGPNTLPPRTRLLSREQISTIWTLLDETGMSTSEKADQTVNFQILPKPKDGSVYMIAINGDGKYWNFVQYIDRSELASPKFTKLIRLLAKYSWVTEGAGIENK